MKIGIDIRNIGKKRTGDEVVFFNLVKNLAEIDGINEYVLFTDTTDAMILSNIKAGLGIESKKNFKIVALETKNRFSWNFWTVQRYLRKNPVDIYLTQYITPWFIPKKIKIFTVIHDISFNFYPRFIKKSDLLFLKILIPISLERADKIITVSNFTRQEIMQHYKIGAEKVVTIYNAVADSFLTADISPIKISAVKNKYNLPEKYILYLGTLQPRKNLPLLIEAFGLLKSNNTGNIKLVIAGGKRHNYDIRIDKAVKKNNLSEEVIFPGFIEEEDKPAVMAGAEIFCFPSLYEGFGIPILEAMSLGIPVAASDIAPHWEIAGDAAVFFNLRNSQELKEKILHLLNSGDFRSAMIEKGRLRFKNFSWKNSAEKYLELFESR